MGWLLSRVPSRTTPAKPPQTIWYASWQSSFRRIPFDECENVETLREKLGAFYAQRSLLKTTVTLEDQAEAAYVLSSNRFSKTTGQIISVDGGLQEAFLR